MNDESKCPVTGGSHTPMTGQAPRTGTGGRTS